MIIPIRCFTCGRPIAQSWEEYSKKVSSGDNPKNVLDSLGIKRYCCRRMFISNCEVIDDILPHKIF